MLEIYLYGVAFYGVMLLIIFSVITKEQFILEVMNGEENKIVIVFAIIVSLAMSWLSIIMVLDDILRKFREEKKLQNNEL